MGFMKPMLDAHVLSAPVNGQPLRWHRYGLNFSRAWGLHALFLATGDTRFDDAYSAHLSAGNTAFQTVRDNYLGVGHWVAQFGMLALQPILVISGSPRVQGSDGVNVSTPKWSDPGSKFIPIC